MNNIFELLPQSSLNKDIYANQKKEKQNKRNQTVYATMSMDNKENKLIQNNSWIYSEGYKHYQC